MGKKEDDETQTTAVGYCRIEKKMTKHISTLNPKGDWVCTLCRSRCSELKSIPKAKRIDYLKMEHLK